MRHKIRQLPLLALLLLLLVACRQQDQVPEMEDKFLSLPSGDTMHYLEAGNPLGKPILFVHGFPTSAYLYRNMMMRICGDDQGPYRCIAMSHIGFGHSSCPDDGSLISPLYEVARLEEFIDLMALEDAALVVHDWGGPIGTLAGLRHGEKFSHLVILNTVLTFPQSGLLEKAMGLTQEFFNRPRPVIEALYPEVMAQTMQLMTTRLLSKEVLHLYSDPYRKGFDQQAACRIHAGINLFAKGHTDKMLFDEIAALAASQWRDKHAIFLWSTDDLLLGANSPVGRIAHREMTELFPQADTIIFSDANHFLQEDRPDDLADAITYFMEN